MKTLQAAGQLHSRQTLIERIAKCQTPERGWEHNPLQALVEATAKGQALKAIGEGQGLRPLRALRLRVAPGEATAKCQVLEEAERSQSLQTLIANAVESEIMQ